jgi:hypothetical protein
VPLTRALAERLAAHYKLPLQRPERAELADVAAQSLLLKGASEAEALYRVVNDFLSQLNPPPADALRQLAEITDCSLFVSLAFDKLLDRALSQVRFGGEQRGRDLWYSPNQSTLEQQRNAIAPAPDEVICYRLFGRACPAPQFAVLEDDRLEWVYAMLADRPPLPEWLQRRLRTSSLLFLGCQLPDWLGLFFLRMLRRAPLSQNAKPIFIIDDAANPNTAITRVLSAQGTNSVRYVATDPDAFVAELNRRWRIRTGLPAAAEPTPEPGAARAGATVTNPSTPMKAGAMDLRARIFISYHPADIKAARSLRDHLLKLGGDVCLDERRVALRDTSWESETHGSIREHTRLFMALISRNTEQRESPIVAREWQEALSRSRMLGDQRFIIPVIVDAAAAAVTSFQQLPAKFLECGLWRAPQGNPDNELKALLTDMLGAMQREVAG